MFRCKGEKKRNKPGIEKRGSAVYLKENTSSGKLALRLNSKTKGKKRTKSNANLWTERGTKQKQRMT